MIAYHIDRQGKLSTGTTLQLSKTPQEILNVLPHLKDGISFHGLKYLSDMSGNPSDIISANIEIFFEFIRIIYFPHKLSRLQSVFACKTKDELDSWLELFKKNQYPNLAVYEIEYNSQHEHLDTSFFTSNISFNMIQRPEGVCLAFDSKPIETINLAKQYWSGLIKSNLSMELMIKPPIKILKRIY